MPTELKNPPRRKTNRGTFVGLTQDPRFQGLSWERKNVALQHFTDRNPHPTAAPLIEIERLRHFSENGSPYSRDFHSDLLNARQQWLGTLLGQGDPVDWIVTGKRSVKC